MTVNFMQQLLTKNNTAVIDDRLEDSQILEQFSKLNNNLITVQRKLAKKTDQLEKLNNLKDHMIGMAAHDLRNPLGVIMNFSEFILEEQKELNTMTDQQKQFLTEIHKSSNLMLNIVNDLLDLTKIESGKIALDLQDHDLVAEVNRIVRLNQILARKKKIDLTFHSNDKPVSKKADIYKLEQVLNNLITNAIKFSESNTAVSVNINCEENESVLLSVADQGQGIPGDELEDLFKPFSKTSVKATAGEQSTGLGLAITRRIVEAHGWDIDVESTVGQGTVFYIRIP